MLYFQDVLPTMLVNTATIHLIAVDIDLSTLLQIQPFVPVPNWLLSRFWNRDKASGTKASRVEEPGQKVPDVKNFFAHYGIRSQDLLLNAWFTYQFT